MIQKSLTQGFQWYWQCWLQWVLDTGKIGFICLVSFYGCLTASLWLSALFAKLGITPMGKNLSLFLPAYAGLVLLFLGILLHYIWQFCLRSLIYVKIIATLHTSDEAMPKQDIFKHADKTLSGKQLSLLIAWYGIDILAVVLAFLLPPFIILSLLPLQLFPKVVVSGLALILIPLGGLAYITFRFLNAFIFQVIALQPNPIIAVMQESKKRVLKKPLSLIGFLIISSILLSLASSLLTFVIQLTPLTEILDTLHQLLLSSLINNNPIDFSNALSRSVAENLKDPQSLKALDILKAIDSASIISSVLQCVTGLVISVLAGLLLFPLQVCLTTAAWFSLPEP
ncbi:MAG: hypothetical protein AAGI66_01935 [Cyanobacteria bacterium P01_H01_bin.74]